MNRLGNSAWSPQPGDRCMVEAHAGDWFYKYVAFRNGKPVGRFGAYQFGDPRCYCADCYPMTAVVGAQPPNAHRPCKKPTNNPILRSLSAPSEAGLYPLQYPALYFAEERVEKVVTPRPSCTVKCVSCGGAMTLYGALMELAGIPLYCEDCE